MTTVREARVRAARKAIRQARPNLFNDWTVRDLADAMVDALFPPDPLIDNLVVSKSSDVK